MSEREAAQSAYRELQKSKNPSTFDTIGAFNKYYTQSKVTGGSLSLPLDMGKSLPISSRADAIAAYNKTQATAPEDKQGFFARAFNGMEKLYNFTTQAVSFGLTLPEKNNPIWQGDFSLDNVKSAWDKAGDISAGRSIMRTFIGRPLDEFEDVFSGVAKAVTFGKFSGADKFLQDHILFAANDFDIFDKKQAETAFREQNFGRFTSFGTDVVSRFVLDPTLIAGKALKTYRAGKLAIEGIQDLNAILAGEKTGRKAASVKATFNDFIVRTDGLDASDLFRVKAIRESANPAAFADILATANKIEDINLRHATKADIVKMAMGDAGAATRLMEQSREVATKIAILQDEVSGAKYFGAGIDKATGQATFDLLNNGADIEKSIENAALLEDELALLHKKLGAEAILDPNKVPKFDVMSEFRMANSQSQAFIDLRAGAAGKPVRVLTGFFYKRPKGWIDFTDNQSVQTVDNMLSRVRGISDKRELAYSSKIRELQNALDSGRVKPQDVKSYKAQIKDLQENLDTAKFTVERKNQLFEAYTSAPDAASRAVAFQKIEEEVFNTVARQFGYDTADVRSAWALFAGGRAKAHNIIRERAYTGAIDPKTGGPVGGKAKPILGSDDMDYIIPMPLNETQLVKQLPVLDVDTMYIALNRHSRARRMDNKGILGKLNRTGLASQKTATDLADGLDSLIKFEVLARIGYPVRNVSEGMLRILTSVGPAAVVAGVTEKGRKIFLNRFKGASIDDIYRWSDETKLQTYRDELFSMRQIADDPDFIDAQIAEIDDMISGKIEIKDKFGLGLREVDGVLYEDALGASKTKANYVQERFINNAAKIVDDHLANSRAKLNNVFETTGDFVVIKGSDANWEEAYKRVINRQVRQSKITSILLQNKPREVVIKEAEDFLTRTDEGRAILRNLAMGRDVNAIVEANMQNVESLFPAWMNPARRAEFKQLALQRQITGDDIKKYLGTDNTRFPDVNAAQVGAANGAHSAIRYMGTKIDQFYKYFGEVPESALVRHPLFVDLYRKRMDAMVRNAIDTYPGDSIPPAYIRKLENSARQWARAEIRRTLYDTSERIDAAYTMRYIFPFFGAFGDVIEKWGRIAINDPSVIRKLQTVYTSPERVGITEERDGKTYINIPGSWLKRMGLTERPVAIPKPSLDLLFQGNAWWNPGAGWFVQIGTSALIKQVPELERVALVKEILPYGPEGTGWSDILVQSAGLRKVLAAFDENDPMRKSLTVLIAMEENHKFDNGLRDTAPTAEEIDSKVKGILRLEAAAKLILPFATNTRSPYQYYIDEYHRLREEDANTATDKFYQMYGDEYYIFTTSLSKNNTGVAATIEADKRASQLSDLLANNPEYGWFIVGEVNSGEFSPSVYRKQFGQPVAPGSTKKMRESQDPYEAIKETQAEKGWLTYNKGIELLEAQRIQRNLKSLNSKGAEDLLKMKQDFIANLSLENPDWAAVRGKIDTNKVFNFLKFASKLAEDPRTANRPDIQSVSEYLNGRSYVMGILASRPSNSLTAAGNEDIKEAWDAFVGDLIDRNITFNRIYTRILENDDLKKGL